MLGFIGHFQNEGTVTTFTEGCCYWFAHILAERFCGGTIMYNPVDNHFAALIGGRLFDITGELAVEDLADWVLWDVYQLVEPLDAGRVYDNCILKL